MRFKQQEKENKEVSSPLVDSLKKLLQIEIDKITLVEAAMSYFFIHGNSDYAEFFKRLHKLCVACKLDLENHLFVTIAELPEVTIHQIKLDDFSSDLKVFELLAAMEDEYVDTLTAIIDIANNDKNWETFSYLIKILDKIDHIGSRAYSAVKANKDVLSLIKCE